MTAASVMALIGVGSLLCDPAGCGAGPLPIVPAAPAGRPGPPGPATAVAPARPTGPPGPGRNAARITVLDPDRNESRNLSGGFRARFVDLTPHAARAYRGRVRPRRSVRPLRATLGHVPPGTHYSGRFAAGALVAARRRRSTGPGHEGIRGRARRRPHRPRGREGRVLQPPRTVRLRQDDDAAHDRRLRAADVRPDRARRAGRDLAAALPAAREHGLPELRAVPAPDDLRERRLRAPPDGRQGRGDQVARHRDAQARRAARVRESQAQPDLGRAGAAGRPRPRPHQRARRPAARRAPRRPRPQAAQADAGRAQAHPEGGRDHVHLRDPRPGGGDDDVRSDRRDEQGRLRAARRPGDAVRAADDPLRGGLPRGQQPPRRDVPGHRRRPRRHPARRRDEGPCTRRGRLRTDHRRRRGATGEDPPPSRRRIRRRPGTTTWPGP